MGYGWFMVCFGWCCLSAFGFSVLLMPDGLVFGLCLLDCGLLNCLLGCYGVT